MIRRYLLFLAGLAVFIIVRLLPVFKQPLYTYGYDYGFYLNALNHPPPANWGSFFGGISGNYFNPLFFLFHLLKLPPATALNLSYFVIAVLVGIAFYFLLDKNPIAGTAAMVLAAVSAAESQAYAMFLWKNMLGLVWLLLAIKFIQEKKWKWLVLTGVLLFLTHRTTLIILLISLSAYLVYELAARKYYKWLGLCLAVFVIAFPFLKDFYHNFLGNPNTDVVAGILLDLPTFFKSTWPTMILAAAGLVFYLKSKEHRFAVFFLGVNLMWVALKLPFYNRIILYLDVALVFFAAYFLGSLAVPAAKKYSWRLAAAVPLCLAIIFGINYNLQLQPLISLDEIKEIREFTGSLPYGFVLAVDSSDAPWLLAFSSNVRLGAPGLFENFHTYEEWQTFWDGSGQKQFLSVYPKPLYLYQRSASIEGDGKSCLDQASRYFYRFVCPN